VFHRNQIRVACGVLVDGVVDVVERRGPDRPCAERLEQRAVQQWQVAQGGIVELGFHCRVPFQE
jgi:hypothetical protein